MLSLYVLTFTEIYLWHRNFNSLYPGHKCCCNSCCKTISALIALRTVQWTSLRSTSRLRHRLAVITVHWKALQQFSCILQESCCLLLAYKLYLWKTEYHRRNQDWGCLSVFFCKHLLNRLYCMKFFLILFNHPSFNFYCVTIVLCSWLKFWACSLVFLVSFNQ